MKSSNLISLSLIANFVGAASISRVDLVGSGVNTTFQPGEFILTNGEKIEVVDGDRLLKFLEAEGILAEPPALDQSWLNFTFVDDSDSSKSELSARQASCAGTTSYVTDKIERFVDWDVQMSPVVLGAGSGIDVFVSSGWSVANSVSVSAGLDIKVVKDRLGGSFGVDFSRTWTSTTSLQYKTTIKDGDAGTWITRPWTNRRYGRTFQGCPGSLRQTGTWIADSHEDGSYDNAKWVSGFITACIKPAPTSGQLTRCHGSGEFK